MPPSGADSFAAWSAQASDKARSIRFAANSATSLKYLSCSKNGVHSGYFLCARKRCLKIDNIAQVNFWNIPGGVIGNTEVFGTSIPGSSPGRVG